VMLEATPAMLISAGPLPAMPAASRRSPAGSLTGTVSPLHAGATTAGSGSGPVDRERGEGGGGGGYSDCNINGNCSVYS
jgi:hypothetical protein